MARDLEYGLDLSAVRLGDRRCGRLGHRGKEDLGVDVVEPDGANGDGAAAAATGLIYLLNLPQER